MNVRAQSMPGTAVRATAPRAGFLYGWLLLALFVEYARPASVLSPTGPPRNRLTIASSTARSSRSRPIASTS